jgi:glutamine---fructose-6-phosphate transaminase (isomerizing)
MADFPGPQIPNPPLGRTRHPYFMHEMIRRQAVAARATRRAIRELLNAEPVVAPERRLLCVGLGTSFHAALAAAEAATRAWGPSREVVARTSFDLLEDPALAGPGTTALVFSAGGETALTVQAQRLLKARGVPQVLFTTEPTSSSRELADRVLPSEYAQEAAWTHTVSFTAGLVAAWTLIEQWVPPLDGALLSEDAVADRVIDALACEPTVVDLVDRFAPLERILILGSGAAEASAREAALKLREGAGRFCATAGVEEFLHGVIPSLNDTAAVLAISGTARERTRALTGLEAARKVGARVLLVDSSGGPEGPDILRLPMTPPPIPAILQVIPFQLLSYWIATAEGRNPDIMGLDDPKVLEARSSFGI